MRISHSWYMSRAQTTERPRSLASVLLLVGCNSAVLTSTCLQVLTTTLNSFFALKLQTESSSSRVHSASTALELGNQETRELKKLAEEKNATLYMVLLSIYNILLAKISGQEDIIIGTAIAGRRHADLHFLIGMFVNTLIMRNYPAGDKTFGEFLVEVKERTLQAFENQDYPFEELVDRLAINRDTSRNPVFDVMLVLQNMAVMEAI